MQLAQTPYGQANALKQAAKVLIVEDEVLFARAVMRKLQAAGYECEHVESLQDARAIAKQFAADLVLLDMRLPDGNGRMHQSVSAYGGQSGLHGGQIQRAQ